MFNLYCDLWLFQKKKCTLVYEREVLNTDELVAEIVKGTVIAMAHFDEGSITGPELAHYKLMFRVVPVRFEPTEETPAALLDNPKVKPLRVTTNKKE